MFFEAMRLYSSKEAAQVASVAEALTAKLYLKASQGRYPGVRTMTNSNGDIVLDGNDLRTVILCEGGLNGFR